MKQSSVENPIRDRIWIDSSRDCAGHCGQGPSRRQLAKVSAGGTGSFEMTRVAAGQPTYAHSLASTHCLMTGPPWGDTVTAR
mgnify:CR=1 FL=1